MHVHNLPLHGKYDMLYGFSAYEFPADTKSIPDDDYKL